MLFSGTDESAQWQAMEGWVRLDGADALYRHALSSGPGAMVEIGNYAGKSTICIARAMQPGRNLIAIDPVRHENFRRNIDLFGVGDIVSHIDSTSLDAVVDWHEPISFLFIDADHRWPYVYADFVVWESFVDIGGIVALDDVAGCIFPGPVMATQMALASGAYEQIESTGGIAFLRKKSHFAPSMAPLSLNRISVAIAHVSTMTGALHPDFLMPIFAYEEAGQARAACAKHLDTVNHLHHPAAGKTIRYLKAVIAMHTGQPAREEFSHLALTAGSDSFIHYSLPITLFALLRAAQCYDLMGDRANAIETYRRILPQCRFAPLTEAAERGISAPFTYPEHQRMPLLRDYALAHPFLAYENLSS
jgi:predicted O-methyltransferase YrrM